MREWQPIETAWKDGTEILLYGPIQQSVAKWGGHAGRGWIVYTGEGWFSYEDTPTHWMPTPEPPK